MFDWLFAPRCPLEPEEAAWVDRRWAWLEEQFGAEAPRRAPLVLPNAAFFPDRWDGSFEAAAAMFERVKGYMGIPDRYVELGFFEDDEQDPLRMNPHAGLTHTEGAAGLYEATYAGQTPLVWISAAQLDDPMALVATMAHELGHVRLLNEGRVGSDEADHEPLTDLVTVFLGLGLFTANSVIRERNWQDGNWHGWSVGRLGYLTQEHFGYALARFALARGEDGGLWATALKRDVRAYLKQSVRWLRTRSSAAP